MTIIDDEAEVEFIPATSEGKPDYDEIDVSAKSFWLQTSEEHEEVYRVLRQTRPVSWQRPVEDAVTPDPDDPGYWAVVRHEDIVRISKDNETFVSRQGVLFDLLPEVFLEMSQSFLAMDDPKHSRLRSLVSAAFTPKQIRKIQADIEKRAAWVVDRIVGKGTIDFVAEVAQQLPMHTFCDLFGIPDELREDVRSAASDVVAWTDAELLGDRSADEVQVEACVRLHEISEQLIAERRANPTDDLLTALVQAEVDGEQLSDFEIGSFFVLMSVAGTDTTTQTTSCATLALTQHPEQKAWLMEDFDGRIAVALEEFLRWASPVMTFRRTAVAETTLGGQTILPGDKVVMFYPSGSFDETVFGDPGTFRLDRNPNPHLVFGGGGVHYCLGNQLAKAMLTAVFRELLTKVPDGRAYDPVFMDSNFMRTIKRMKFDVNG
ncbi:cytochrome P450 [Branchiibius hedensis]|uniref:Cytochrome P450 n=1 Tax=Branchiibius hedensis TaxID=672460 RepID=A0A2Y9BSR3_9MICO|nr:cytochrome P450 [Branchiibius hedensis]PWJ23944.1 cytochrome P450 [Branchiibius hedensis]SSA32762.1 Cytochrome P450 [Branchiibius hedensis]